MKTRSAAIQRSADEVRSLNKFIGAKLKLRRTLLGLTQEQLASECGLTYQQIHNYESGRSNISTARLMEFTELLETSLYWFLDGIDAPTTTEAEPRSIIEGEDAARLLSIFHCIKNPKRRKQLIAFASLLADEP